MHPETKSTGPGRTANFAMTSEHHQGGTQMAVWGILFLRAGAVPDVSWKAVMLTWLVSLMKVLQGIQMMFSFCSTVFLTTATDVGKTSLLLSGKVSTSIN